MIVACFLLLVGQDCNIDSLKAALERDRCLQTVFALNTCYLRRGEYAAALELLAECEEKLPADDRPAIVLQRGDNLLFAGSVPEARDVYLGFVADHPRDEKANDALERLYLLEKNRSNMLLLKRLARAMGLIHTGQYGPAEDSLKALIGTDAGMYACVLLAQAYTEQDKLPLALGVYGELDSRYPGQTLGHARLAHGMLCLLMGDTLNARAVLEDLVLRNPASLYADRARDILRGTE